MVSVVSLLVIAVTPTKTTEPIEVVLGAWPRVGSSTMSWMGARFSLGEKAFFLGGGISQLDVNIMEYPAILSTLFGRWQHRCGLLLSVLQQLDVGAKSGVYDCNLQLLAVSADHGHGDGGADCRTGGVLHAHRRHGLHLVN